MVSIKNKARRVIGATSLGMFSGVTAASTAAAILSVIGLAAHGTGYLLHDDLENYSVNHRFSAAYNINAPESHKYYYANGMATDYEMTPALMYSLLGASAFLSGMLGARIGYWIACDSEDKKWRNLGAKQTNQRTR